MSDWEFKYLNTPWKIEYNSDDTEVCITDRYGNYVLKDEWYHRDYYFLLTKIVKGANNKNKIIEDYHIKKSIIYI